MKDDKPWKLAQNYLNLSSLCCVFLNTSIFLATIIVHGCCSNKAVGQQWQPNILRFIHQLYAC